MPQEDPPVVPVLDYARERPRFCVHWPATFGAAVVLLLLNVLPHFQTTFGPGWSDAAEPELGWPRVFYWSGESFSGPGPFFELQPLCLDVMLGLAAALLVGYAACRFTRR